MILNYPWQNLSLSWCLQAGGNLERSSALTVFHTDADVVVLYETHLLSYLEYITPAIYHATRAILRRRDNLQIPFLEGVGVDEATSLRKFHLAPLGVRRDISMPGLIHRTALGKGPAQFREFFKKDPCSIDLHDPRKDFNAPITKRSALGLVAVYTCCLLVFLLLSLFLRSREVCRNAWSSSLCLGTHNGRKCFLLASRLSRTLSGFIRKSWRLLYNAVCAGFSISCISSFKCFSACARGDKNWQR